LSPFILTAVGEIVSGPLNDWLCIHLTRKNKGIYEPEFRLPLILVAVVFGTVGFFGFGASIHYETHWTGPVLCFGLANMSLVFASTCVFGYIVSTGFSSSPSDRHALKCLRMKAWAALGDSARH
jgi:hypothetical protein